MTIQPAASADGAFAPDPALMRRMANAIRALSMDAVEKANSGHPGMPMGMADVATVLFTQFLKYDPSAPDWPDRDRFVLSAGHGSMLLYSLLHLTGYADMTMDQIRNFRQLGSITAGHPEYGHATGVETTTGPLGQGLATAVGMALAERLLNTEFGDGLVDHHTYVIASDGDLMEGISHEAISLAGHLNLDRLIVLFDDNGISIDGPLALAESGDQIARFKAAGWHAEAVDGHDMEAVAAAITRAKTAGRPAMIACRTVIGYGAPTKKGTAATHGAALGAEEVAGARRELDWPHDPFEIPGDVLSAWRAAGSRHAATRKAWEARLAASETRALFERRQRGDLPEELTQAVRALKKSLAAEPRAVATRKASETALEAITAAVPEMVGGSADLTGSNNTRTKAQQVVAPGSYGGRFIHFGVREHGMAAAMNGIALHKGLIPYSGTFLVFADYARPAIRLAALMNQRVIHVMTHDSIGLGEDGPTHQPIAHLASLRAMPNVHVFRPADAVETAECWQAALEIADGPSVLALTRQNLAPVRTTHTDENLSARGAYELAAASGTARVSLLATGSEVEIALDAREKLEAQGIPTRVVSMPCWELFEAQEAAYREDVLRPDTVRIAIEAAAGFGWERYTGPDGGFVGMTGFGASAPYKALYEHFGITAEAVADLARKKLG
jgi:transketolase